MKIEASFIPPGTTLELTYDHEALTVFEDMKPACEHVCKKSFIKSVAPGAPPAMVSEWILGGHTIARLSEEKSRSLRLSTKEMRAVFYAFTFVCISHLKQLYPASGFIRYTRMLAEVTPITVPPIKMLPAAHTFPPGTFSATAEKSYEEIRLWKGGSNPQLFLAPANQLWSELSRSASINEQVQILVGWLGAATDMLRQAEKALGAP
jgi:hypothetical protein